MNINDEHLMQLNSIKDRFLRNENLLSYEEVAADSRLCQKLQKEQNELSPIASPYIQYLDNETLIEEYKDLVRLSTSTEQIQIYSEIENLSKEQIELKDRIMSLLRKHHATLDTISIEIVCTQELSSQNLANDILQGYLNFCQNQNYECNIIRDNKNVIIEVTGLNAKSEFANELGLHKLGNTNIQVFIYDTFKEKVNKFDERDLTIITCHASGAGGQHINTTDSAIKVTHNPTRLSCVCQNERSQLQNKQRAIENLKVKVENFYKKQKSTFVANQKKKQVQLIQNKYVAKTYDYELGLITKNDGQTINIKEFLQGKII